MLKYELLMLVISDLDRLTSNPIAEGAWMSHVTRWCVQILLGENWLCVCIFPEGDLCKLYLRRFSCLISLK